MIISSDTQIVNKNITTYKCPVIGDGTVLLSPSKVNKYLGSYIKHKIVNFGILIPKNYILDIICKDTIDNKKWLLVIYKNNYFYTPEEYVNTNNLITDQTNLLSVNNNIKKSSPNNVSVQKVASSVSSGDAKREQLFKDDFIIGTATKDIPLYGNVEVDNNDIGYIMKAGEKCIIQSIWKNTKYNSTFFGTQSFTKGCLYGRNTNDNIEYDDSGKRFYSIIYKSIDTKYFNGDHHGRLVRGDRTWPAYQDWDKGTHIVADPGNVDGAAGKGITVYQYPANVAAPLADGPDMFDKKYLGTLEVNRTSVVYAMHRKSNYKSSKDKKYSLDNISIAALDKCTEAKNIIAASFQNYTNVTNAEDFKPGEVMIVTNYITIFGMKCYVGFRETGATNGAVNYIILKDQEEGKDYITYNPFPPQEVDNSGNIPVNGVPDLDTWDTTSNVNTQNYDDPTRDGSDKVGNETAWGMHLGIGDTSPFKVPGIIEGAPTVPPDYSGWPITADVQNYNLSSEKPFDNKHLTHINRFHLPTAMGGLSTKSFIFVTRPDLNLYTENDDETIDTWHMNPNLKRLPGFKYIARLRGTPESPGIGNTIMNSLEYYGTDALNTPWLSVFTNQATGYSITDREMDIVELGETFHGNKIVYAEPTFKHKVSGTVSIPFNERRDLTLYFTLRMWIEYMQAISLGYCEPRRVHRRNNELDYAVSLFYITTDETMENILYWEKLTGLIPLTVPDSFFEWTEGSGAREMKYNINFAYSFRTVMDELHLCEINNLYTKWRNTNPTGMPLVPADNYYFNNNPGFNQLLGRVAAFYGDITDSDEALANFVNDEAKIRQYYYGGIINSAGTAVEDTSYVNNGTVVAPAKFLPNYSMHTHMHGIPYVKGPFIEHDPAASKYILRWV